MTGVNLKTVHEINIIQNGGGERQEFRRSYRRSESSFGEIRAPLKEEKKQSEFDFYTDSVTEHRTQRRKYRPCLA